MMAHLPILPVVIPLLTAVALLVLADAGIMVKRAISLAGIVTLVAAAVSQLVVAGDGIIHVYRLGDWPAPYGIVLVLDRLSALMVALTSFLALPVVLAAMSGTDT